MIAAGCGRRLGCQMIHWAHCIDSRATAIQSAKLESALLPVTLTRAFLLEISQNKVPVDYFRTLVELTMDGQFFFQMD